MAVDTFSQEIADPTEAPRGLLALLILDLLRVRALVEEGNWTTCDICGAVREVMTVECRDVIEVLEQLRTLGLVRKLSHAETADVASTWVAAPAYTAALERNGDGGPGGITPREGAPPPRPRRFPEVLAHPTLFALSPEDFQATLTHMLPE